ncbi:MAG: hypothetical protein GY754_14980 [bacterium]|nr:hypothetical protein [bacterium]
MANTDEKSTKTKSGNLGKSARKQYLIDKEFQRRTTFSIIGIVTLITAIIVGVIGANVFINNDRIENIYELENSIFTSISTISEMGMDTETNRKTMQLQFKNHDNNMKNLQNLMFHNKILLLIILSIVVIQGFILYILLIRKTHRISGPIYVISNYMKEIIEGKYPYPRPLRDKDELKDFYELFKKMIRSLEDRNK